MEPTGVALIKTLGTGSAVSDRTDKTPDELSQRGVPGEVQRHYATRSDVQELLEPLHKHLGYHEGFRFTAALVIPLICVLVSAAAVLIAALVP